MEISIVKELSRAYDYKKQKFEPSIEEEFLVRHGRYADQIDVPYLCRAERISHGRVRKEIHNVFGTQVFDTEKNKNEVSKELFLEYYEFGLYPNVREWIGHIYRATGGILTREKLFQYLTEDNVDRRWETLPNESFV
jgi:hypothetical protein